MLLTNSLIAGGALYTGVKIYKERQNRTTNYWSSVADRLRVERSRKKSTLFTLGGTSIPLRTPSTIASAKEALSEFKKEKISPLFIDPRQQQLKEISSTSDESQMSEEEQKLNRDLTIASVSFGLATSGALLYPPLSLLSVPGLFWISIVSCKNAYESLKEGRRVGMDLVDIVFFSGCLVTGHYFAGTLAAWFGRFGKKILSKTEDQANLSLTNIFGDQKRFAWLLKNDLEVNVQVEALSIGDTIIVHAGEIIPIDGTITFGRANIDQHVLTGESQPVEKEAGDQVFASTVVLAGKIQICVDQTGQDTVAAKIGQILERTTDFKTSIESWGQEIGNKSAQGTLIVSALTLPLFGATVAITILNTCVGFYMRVLGPLSMLSFLNLASQQGILVKDGRSLQLLTQIDTVVFDKTGTLTLEQPHVAKIHTCLGMCEEQLLTLAAAAEYKQTHPYARAILEAANKRGLTLPAIGEAKYEIGYGLKVSIPNHPALLANGTVHAADTKVIRVGSARFMKMESIVIPPHIKQLADMCILDGHSFVYVAINDELAGAIELHATIRPEAKQVMSELRKRNMEMVIISGDHEQPTKKLAQELGIDNYFAETLPQNKADLISKLIDSGKSVCFVGDGINDSIALKKANVSVSLRGASSAATDTAQIVLMNQDLNQLIEAFDVAQRFETNMKLNIITTVLPGLITIYGIFFLGFGIAHSVILNDMGVVIGASNAIWPWLKEQRSRR